MEPAARAPVQPDPKTWTQLAQARLRELLGEIEAITAKQAEAERVWRALSAAEVTDLPTLPWLAAKPKKAAATTRGHYNRKCSRCGKALGLGEVAREGGPTGPFVCRQNCPALAVLSA